MYRLPLRPLLTLAALALALSLLPLSALADQNSTSASGSAPSPLHDYRVDLTVIESEGGKRIESHSYGMNLRERDVGQVRIGSNILLGGASAVLSGQPTLPAARADVGAKIDCRIEDRGGSALIHVDVELSTLVAEDRSSAPVVHKLSFATTSTVALDQPTVVASADDVAGKRHYQLEVKVDRLK